MNAPPQLPSESARLAALAAYAVLDTAREEAFDDLTELAAHICQAPIALISLVAENRQWFKSRIGIDVAETSRSVSFCAHAICSPELLVVPDTNLDQRFADNPLVTAEPRIRFYAGAPLINADGHALGTLCVIDRVPRELNPDHAQALRILSRHVMAQLELRRQTIELSRLKEDQRVQLLAARVVEANERRYRLLFEQNPHPMWVFDTETLRFLAVNEQACATYGYSREEFLALTIRDIRPAEDVPELLATLASPDAVTTRFGTFRHTTKTGTILSVEITSHPIDWNGISGRLVLATDVTERTRNEEARARLATAVEQAAESIIITDVDGVITYVNPAFEAITGYTREEAKGQSTRMLRSGQHDVVFYDQLWATLARGEPWHGRVKDKRKDGTLIDVEMTISPIRNHEGKVVNFVAVQRDVTREAALEAQVRHAQKLETVGRLASGVAHDLNNILTVVRGNVEELLGAMAHPNGEQELQEIAEASERAAKLTRQLLVFGRKDAVKLAYLDWNEIVRNLIPMLRRLLDGTIELSCNLAQNLPAVRADRGMMEQVLLNFVVNARDALANGGKLTIATSVEKLTPQQMTRRPRIVQAGTYVCVEVSDTGSGIAPETLQRIFDPFFTTKDPGKGTGLGLATVHDIVKQHEGWVEVESEVAVGTAFKVFFPAVSWREKEVPGTSQAGDLPTGSEVVLVVEGDPSVRKLVYRVLTRCGYEVLQTGSVVTARNTFEEHQGRIELLFTDLVLPGGVSGQTLASQLLVQNPNLKVLFTSGQGVGLESEQLEVDASDYLRKPWSPKELACAIRARLDRQ